MSASQKFPEFFFWDTLIWCLSKKLEKLLLVLLMLQLLHEVKIDRSLNVLSLVLTTF